MTAMKRHGEKDSPSPEKESTAKVTPASEDIMPMAAQSPPSAPWVAGTPYSITPYTRAGFPTIYMLGGVQLQSEGDVLQTLKNQLFKPPVKLS